MASPSRPRTGSIGILLLTLLACAAAVPSAASAAPVRDIIVVRESGVSAAGRADLRSDADVVHLRSLPLRDAELVRAPEGELAVALKTLNADPDVRYAEPNSVVHGQSWDPMWSSLWGLENTGQTINSTAGVPDADIDAREAWASSQGAGVRVGVLDSGLDFTQPDLLGQVAVNPGESGDGKDDNGEDDDSNGYVDDVNGWDVIARDNNPADENGHGTHVSGIIAATADNGIGVAGVAPSAQVVPLRVLDDRGSGFITDVIEAIDYAADMGLVAVNASLTGSYSHAEQDMIAAHPEMLIVAAAGNGGDDAIGDDVDAAPLYPCSFPEPNVICVGASDNRDRPATFSNYGAVDVDLFAPGVGIVSTWMHGGPYACGFPCFEFAQGTSMAAPHVTGAAALMRAANPELSAEEIKARLLGTAELKPALAGRSVSGARLNAGYAVASATSGSDSDDDGVDNRQDNCRSVANSSQLDADGDGRGDACDPDDDNDTVDDGTDNCPLLANVGQADIDTDGLGDVCDATPRGADTDRDGVGALDDNCPALGNVDQRDTDADRAGDACDPDDDNDGDLDRGDTCRLVANADQLDADRDGAGDVCDLDDDNDGKADRADNCPFVSNPGQSNADGDALGDDCDPTPGLRRPATPPAPRPSTSPVPVAPIVAPPPSIAGVRAPVLSAVRLLKGRLTRKHSRTVRFDLDRAAATRLSVLRKSGGRYRTLRTVAFRGRAGQNRYVLRLTFGRLELRPGRYRLTVRASDGTLRSKTRSVSFRVRRLVPR